MEFINQETLEHHPPTPQQHVPAQITILEMSGTSWSYKYVGGLGMVSFRSLDEYWDILRNSATTPHQLHIVEKIDSETIRRLGATYDVDLQLWVEFLANDHYYRVTKRTAAIPSPSVQPGREDSSNGTTRTEREQPCWIPGFPVQRRRCKHQILREY